MKDVLINEEFFFLENWPTISFSWLACYVLVGFCLKQKVVPCILSFWRICVMLRSYILILFNIFEFFQSQALFYHCKHWNYSKPKTAWAHTQLDFPVGYANWVVKYKANYFGWRIIKKRLKLTKLMTETSSFISKYRLIY